MQTIRPTKNDISNLITSPGMNDALMRIMVLGLIFVTLWLIYYVWIIIATPYQAEYREGSILLMTDFFARGINPFSLDYQPLMNNNYGFLYNLVVLPFANVFGNTLAIHRLISILFIAASGILIVLTLVKSKVSLLFASSGGILMIACLLFGVTPLARPDALGEFLFLSSILLPWYYGFTRRGLMASIVFGTFAFLAKPYFLLSLVIVSVYVFIFVSKRKGFWYLMSFAFTLGAVLYIVNLLFECYFIGAILSNAGNTNLSNHYLWKQLTIFVIIFLPCLIIIALDAKHRLNSSVRVMPTRFSRTTTFDFAHPDDPLYSKPMNYFGFFLLCSSMVVVFLLGKHIGAYMTYFFQLITPGLVLFTFRNNELFQGRRTMVAPLVLSNILIVCFQVLFPNKLLPSEQKNWDDLNAYVKNSNNILNSPVLVAEMVNEHKTPVDSGQSEYYFTIMPYNTIPFAPQYGRVEAQGERYLNDIRTAVRNQEYDYVFLTVGLRDPFLSRQLLDEYYVPIKRISITMPQSGEHWTIEVRVPKK